LKRDNELCFANGYDDTTRMKWICFSFNCYIQVIEYHLKSWRTNAHLKSWIVEDSLDGINWNLLDEHENETYLSQNFAESQFICQHIDLCSHTRLTMTNSDSRNEYWLLISGIEFYGFIH
jgi:hypothetical protein